MNIHNTYAALDARLYHKQNPKPLLHAKAGHFNTALAQKLNLDTDYWYKSWVDIISGNTLLDGFEPLAMAYAGHQFGVWAGQLGDGRGLLLAQVADVNGKLQDLHLKGAGQTPYSRMGDGLAVLRSVVREYLAGHALNALGVHSSNALGFVVSDEPVRRERIEPRAAMLRVADSHIRLGHFEWINAFAPDLLGTFTRHVLHTHYPHCLNAEQPIYALAKAVVKNTAKTIANWQLVGFGHGVMNTDNLSITGATLDFGPFAFLERFDPAWIFNHTDTHGRYTYQNQPAIAHWNLSVWLGQLLRLTDLNNGTVTKPALASILDTFEATFLDHYKVGMANKLGLKNTAPTFNWAMAWLQLLQDAKLDYTNSFRALSSLGGKPVNGDKGHTNSSNSEHGRFSIDATRNELDHAEHLVRFDALIQEYNELIQTSSLPDRFEVMRHSNPVYILRTSMAERAIKHAEQGDFDEVVRLFELLANPFEEQSIAHPADTKPPSKGDIMPALSCSS